MSSSIVVNGLSKSYRPQEFVLKDVNFRIDQGESVCLTAPNGAGKTTLLKMISTLLPPTMGTIFINEISVLDKPKKIHAYIGLMPSGDTGMFARLSGKKNLLYFAAFYRLWPREVEKILVSWKNVEIIKEALETPFYLCSTGMKRALLLLKAIIHSPTILLLDEPMGSFDLKTRTIVADKLKEYAKDRIVLYTSHHQEDTDILNPTRKMTIMGGNVV